MYRTKKVAVVIPAYNEAKSIKGVLKGVKKIKYIDEIIVVDDGSIDNTTECARKMGAKVIRQPYNKGNGSAVKLGIKEAIADVIIIIDADGQHNPDDISTLLSFIGEYDLVIGTRDKDSYSYMHRRFGNFILRKLASYLAGFKIPELTSGFRAFKKNTALEFMHLYPNGYSFPATSTLAFLVGGYNVKFCPVKMLGRHKDTKSKLSPIKEGIKFLGLILRIITVFNPIKVFLPISVILFLVGFSYAIIYIIKITHIPAGASFLMLTGLIIFFFGMLADQISILRRTLK